MEDKYKQMLAVAYDLISVLKKEGKLSCALPCIYCRHYDNHKEPCRGRFEWLFDKAIAAILREERSNDTCGTE